MKIPDILRLNDWPIKKFVLSILSILIVYDTIFLIDKTLFKIPILPQLLGFIILTFILGFIIIRILKIHNNDRTTSLLLAVGLSLSFIMISCLFINMILPYMGISRPISLKPLFYGINCSIFTLLIFSYMRDKEFEPLCSQEFLNVYVSPSLLFLLLLPFLSILGAQIMTFYNSNALILFLLFLISLIPMLVILDKIPEDLYPLLIFVISISILYQLNLISMHLWSFDIFPESYSANLIVEKGIWDPTLYISTHSLPLMTILAPTYSLLCELNIVWVFKIIFPFLFALTPVSLYQIYQRFDIGDYKFSPKLALLSVFVFIFFYGFYKDMPDKQHIAEFFLALTLMSMIIKNPNRITMTLIFSFSLIMSHYGVSYIFMLSLIFAILLYITHIIKREEKSLLTPNFVLLFSILAISWYMYVASGILFYRIVNVGRHFLINISEILRPDARSGMSYLFYETQSVTWLIYKLIHLILQFLIAVGVLKLLISLFKGKIKRTELSLLSLAFYILLLFQITTTYGMGFDRILQITLTLLSPLALVGCISMFKTVKTLVFHKEVLEMGFSIPIKFFTGFLIIFILFNSGFVFSMVGDKLPVYCISLNKSAGWPIFNQQELIGVNWLKEQGVENIWTISYHDALILSTYYQEATEYYQKMHRKKLPLNTPIYIGKQSIIITVQNLNNIYSNGESSVYWKVDYTR